MSQGRRPIFAASLREALLHARPRCGEVGEREGHDPVGHEAALRRVLGDRRPPGKGTGSPACAPCSTAFIPLGRVSMASEVMRAWAPGPRPAPECPARRRTAATRATSARRRSGDGVRRGRGTGRPPRWCGDQSTRATVSEPDLGGARGAQRARAGPGGGAGGVHVVDEHDHAAGHPRPVPHGKGAGHVGPPPGRGQARLAGGVGAPHQGARREPGPRRAAPARAARSSAWLKPRSRRRRGCSGTGTSTSAPPRTSRTRGSRSRRWASWAAARRRPRYLSSWMITRSAPSYGPRLAPRANGERPRRQRPQAAACGDRSGTPHAHSRRRGGAATPSSRRRGARCAGGPWAPAQAAQRGGEDEGQHGIDEEARRRREGQAHARASDLTRGPTPASPGRRCSAWPTAPPPGASCPAPPRTPRTTRTCGRRCARSPRRRGRACRARCWRG